MPTSYQYTGVRRPFGSVNTNTLRAGLRKSTGSDVNATHPIKNEKKGILSRRGLFSTILTTAKKAGKPESSGTDEVPRLDSPTKKARVIDDKGASASRPTSYAHDYDAIFRRSTYLSAEDNSNNFWTDEMEEMLTLRPSRPITESLDDDELPFGGVGDEMMDKSGRDACEEVRNALIKELDVNDISAAKCIISLRHGHLLREHESDGIQIEFR